MANCQTDEVTLSNVIESTIAQLEEEDNHVLLAEQIDILLDSTQFM